MINRITVAMPPRLSGPAGALPIVSTRIGCRVAAGAFTREPIHAADDALSAAVLRAPDGVLPCGLLHPAGESPAAAPESVETLANTCHGLQGFRARTARADPAGGMVTATGPDPAGKIADPRS
ncbi:hypothetical protein ACOJVU_04820 [Mycobacterium sp. THU-M104]